MRFVIVATATADRVWRPDFTFSSKFGKWQGNSDPGGPGKGRKYCGAAACCEFVAVASAVDTTELSRCCRRSSGVRSLSGEGRMGSCRGVGNGRGRTVGDETRWSWGGEQRMRERETRRDGWSSPQHLLDRSGFRRRQRLRPAPIHAPRLPRPDHPACPVPGLSRTSSPPALLAPLWDGLVRSDSWNATLADNWELNRG